MLLSDPATRTIYPELPLVSYRRDRNLRDYLVHSAESTDSDAGTFACRHPRCLTCQHTTSQTILQSPKSLYTIRDHFTCLSVNVVYSIICRRCGCFYIGETGRRLRERFGEHVRSIRNNSPGFPVAEHFNSASHSLKDGAYYCYCAYVLRISRYSDFLPPMLTNTGIFLRGLKLSGESIS